MLQLQVHQRGGISGTECLLPPVEALVQGNPSRLSYYIFLLASIVQLMFSISILGKDLKITCFFKKGN